MVSVARLVTFLDIGADSTSTTRMHISARHEAELTDGRRILLLDDRGWTESVSRTSAALPDIWTSQSLEEIRETARVVVGPDEPPEGLSHEEEAMLHWGSLANVLRRHGVAADADELRRLPHEVVPSARLLARIGHPPPDGSG